MTDIAIERAGSDLKVVSLIGCAHCASHFFQLVLPPLFALMSSALGVGYTELGFLMTVYFITSGLAQTAMGFLVDRWGAQRILPAGLAALGLWALGAGLAGAYWQLIPLAMLGGLGNSVFHPCDYSVLSSRVSPTRIARAYSVHTVSGSIGWALAPVTMLALAERFSWRGALVIVGLVALGLAAFLASERRELEVGRSEPRTAASPASSAGMALLTAPVVMSFVYFTMLSLALGGIQSFMPTMLPKVQDVTLGFATAMTTAYLVANAAGSFTGGYVADRTRAHDRVVAAGLGTAAALVLVLGFAPIAAPLLFAAGTLSGFLSGITIPSRDMLVRAATPPGATGKVFGFVYSGLDLGSLITPVVIGALIDRGLTPVAFVFIAAGLALTIAAAVGVKLFGRAS